MEKLSVEELKKLENKIILYNCFFKYAEKYSNTDCDKKYLPQNLIKLYYEITDDISFDLLKSSFVKHYIDNESEVEKVHSNFERKGLREMYKYLHQYDTSKMDIYTILELHEKLYMHGPHPEFGGHFRTAEAFLPGSGADLCDHWNIRYKIIELKPYVKELIEKGKELHGTTDFNKLFSYIEECIKLKCDLMRIHPFQDGNGRCLRGFTNMLFELSNIPPIYVRSTEQFDYRKAMRDTDIGMYDNINNFYYHKICESIIELELDNMRKENKKALKLLKPYTREDN